MKIKNLLYLLSVCIFLIACQQEKGITIKGDIQNTQDIKVYFDKKGLDNAVQSIQNTDMKNGKFSLNFPESMDPGLYRVRIGAKAIDLILRGDEKNIDISGDLSTLQTFDYSISGSDLSDKYQKTIKQLINKEKTLPQMFKESVTNDDALLSMSLALGTSPPNPQMHATYTQISNKLKEQYGSTAIAAEFSNFSALMKKNFDMSQSRYRVKVGEQAPDIVMEDTNGKIRKLSDLKGQVVLLDFWASWCGPCRRANPKVVDTYHKFKDKGFTVFNVSLDGLDERTKKRFPADQLDSQMKRSKQRWLDAIKKDNLVWDNHVSDLKKWDSSGAALYGVRSIPTTFLIDKDGKIAVLNPNKNNLANEITKLL